MTHALGYSVSVFQPQSSTLQTAVTSTTSPPHQASKRHPPCAAVSLTTRVRQSRVTRSPFSPFTWPEAEVLPELDADRLSNYNCVSDPLTRPASTPTPKYNMLQPYRTDKNVHSQQVIKKYNRRTLASSNYFRKRRRM